MILSKLVPAALALGLLAVPAASEPRRLVCKMNDYSGADLSGVLASTFVDAELDIRSVVPPSATHVFDRRISSVEGTDMTGTSVDRGSRITLQYEITRLNLGKVSIRYSYIKSTGIMVAIALVHRQRPMTARIAGTCEYFN